MKTQAQRLGIALMAAAFAIVWAPSANAITLTDLNSSVDIDPNSQAGVYNWVVDGNDMLYQQWFWYRIGSTGGEHSIDTLGPAGVTQFGPRIVELNYAVAGLAVDITYTLTGGAAGSTQSDLDEVIRIRNTGNTALDFHFFQYSDFDLCDIGGDTVNVTNGFQVSQSDATCSLSETVVVPRADRWEAGGYPSTLISLTDGSPTTLSGNSSFGPGDATWAYEWDRTINAGGSLVISKNKSIQPIPEPGTLTLIGIGAGLAGLARKRRKT